MPSMPIVSLVNDRKYDLAIDAEEATTRATLMELRRSDISGANEPSHCRDVVVKPSVLVSDVFSYIRRPQKEIQTLSGTAKG